MSMFTFPFAIFKIADNSMEPTLHEGDYVIVNKRATARKGDIVVSKHPMKNIFIIKRVKKVGEDSVFLNGDNVEESIDSRHFGAVDKNSIFGKMILKI
ncbi:MAG: nickel-type superoxide dismutase maturation protease [Candidatus Micrarchaeales archaeon]